MGSTMFGTGKAAPKMFPALSTAVPRVIVDTAIRCQGIHRGKPCARLLARRAGRPWTLECRGCGYVNDSEDGTWRA